MTIKIDIDLVPPPGRPRNLAIGGKRQPFATIEGARGGSAFEAWARQGLAVAAAAITAGVTEATAGLKGDLRSRVEAGGLGARFPLAIRAEVYPRGDVSAKAAGWVYVKGRRTIQILDAYSRGVTIRGASRRYLAIPTEAAGKSGGRFARITPATWQARTGLKLRAVKARGKDYLLLVANLRRSKGKRGGFRVPTEAARRRRDYESVVVFILVRQVVVPKRITIEGLGEYWANRVPGLIDRAMAQI